MNIVEIIPPDKIPLAENILLDENSQFLIKDLSKIVDAYSKLEYVCKKHKCNAISATQIGIPYKIVATFFNDNFLFYVNPFFEGTNKIATLETCISFQGKSGLRLFENLRFRNIEFTANELKFFKGKIFTERVTKSFNDKQAIIVQQSMDFLLDRYNFLDCVGREIE